MSQAFCTAVITLLNELLRKTVDAAATVKKKWSQKEEGCILFWSTQPTGDWPSKTSLSGTGYLHSLLCNVKIDVYSYYLQMRESVRDNVGKVLWVMMVYSCLSGRCVSVIVSNGTSTRLLRPSLYTMLWTSINQHQAVLWSGLVSRVGVSRRVNWPHCTFPPWTDLPKKN